jgi:hypothetical protein
MLPFSGLGHQIKEEWLRHEASMGDMITAFKISVEKPERKRHFGYLGFGGNRSVNEVLREM